MRGSIEGVTISSLIHPILIFVRRLNIPLPCLPSCLVAYAAAKLPAVTVQPPTQ